MRYMRRARQCSMANSYGKLDPRLIREEHVVATEEPPGRHLWPMVHETSALKVAEALCIQDTGELSHHRLTASTNCLGCHVHCSAQHSRSYALYKSIRKPELTGKRLKPLEILVKHCVLHEDLPQQHFTLLPVDREVDMRMNVTSVTQHWPPW